jgi:signal transduction histidine kinase
LKLFDRYNQLNISATILTFVIGSCAFYFLINYILIHQLDETLQTEEQEVTTYISTHNALPEIISTRDQYTTYEPASSAAHTTTYTTRNNYRKGKEDLREIRFTVLVKGKYFLVRVSKPLEETEDLLKVIIGVTMVMIAIILLMGYLINRIVIRRLWKPFYDTISSVDAYHISNQEALNLASTNIDEFSLLNQAINKMVERIQQDYGSLKNFTGQAAHEIQTPLAIIRTRLDMLMQNDSFLKEHAQFIVDMEKSVQRLSRLHQSLLLLTKVENKQFVLNDSVSIEDIVRDKCYEYTEMAVALKLTFKTNLEPFRILFHQQLAEIVVSNLLGNAVKYNKTGGEIDITLKNGQLSISNTSANAALDTNKLFKRFYRGEGTSEGNGLGLSIVKQICDLAGYPISYGYEQELHTFTISFAEPTKYIQN